MKAQRIRRRYDHRLRRLVHDTGNIQLALRNGVPRSTARDWGSRGYMRVGFVTQIRREEFVSFQDTSFAVPDSLTASVGAFFEWRAARFLVVTHYNGFSREEDIDLSTRIRIGAWVAPSGFGYERSGVGPLLDAQTGFVFGKNFGRIRVRVNGLLTATTLDSGTVVATMTISSRIIARQATVLHVEGFAAGEPADKELIITTTDTVKEPTWEPPRPWIYDPVTVTVRNGFATEVGVHIKID